MVIGETLAAAQDGAEAVAVDYATREPVVDCQGRRGERRAAGASPKRRATSRSTGPASRPIRRPTPRRSSACSPRPSTSRRCRCSTTGSTSPRWSRAARPRATTPRPTCSTCGSARRARAPCATRWRGVLKIGNDKIRVTTEEVGGAFGLKTGPYPEYIAILAAAKKIGRPVYWMCGRSEAFLTDNHARDAYSDVELALDEKGKFLALRIRHIGNMGAYIGAVGANIQTINMMRCLPGMYDIKLVDAQTRCVFTNTVVTAPYRGAGRPEASYCIERVVDEAARITGIDPVKLRKRNLISRKAMPYKTAVGTTYDSGDFAAVIDQGLALADYDGFKARKKESKKQRPAARPRRLLRAGALRRRADRRPDDGLPRRQHARSHAQRAVDRPGPRHHLPAPGRRAARHQVRADQAPPRRQPPRGRGLRLGRLALGDDGRPFDGEDHRGDRSPRARRSPPRRWRPARATSNTRTARSTWSAPTAASRCSTPRPAPPR